MGVHFACRFCSGKATAVVEEYRRRFPRWKISDRRVFSNVHRQMRKIGLFLSMSWTDERSGRQNVDEEENVVKMAQSSPRVSNRRIAARLHTPRMTVWRTLHSEGLHPYCSQGILHLNLGICVDVWNSAVFLMHIPACITTFYSPTRYILLGMGSKIPSSRKKFPASFFL